MEWFSLVILILAVAIAFWRIATKMEVRTPKAVLGTLIIYLIVFGIGIQGLWEFLCNVLYSDQTAQYVGWNSGSPFQIVVGVANLAFGILGILCLWESEDFWLATALGASIFFFGSGLEHLWQIVTRNNVAPGNAGVGLYVDLIFPIVLMVLMMVYRRLKAADSRE